MTVSLATYWEPDALGDGTQVKLFTGTFRHWCLQNEAHDLVKTSSSHLIQEIKRLPKWGFIRAFRPASNEPRRYRVKLKAGAKIPNEVLRGDYDDLV
jgi:hypothetical protein